jgi:hypothetical protein
VRRQSTRGMNNDVSTRLAILHRDVHQRIEQRFGQEVRLEPEVEQLRVLRIVVVLFPLDTRIWKVLDPDVEAEVARPRSAPARRAPAPRTVR